MYPVSRKRPSFSCPRSPLPELEYILIQYAKEALNDVAKFTELLRQLACDERYQVVSIQFLLEPRSLTESVY